MKKFVRIGTRVSLAAAICLLIALPAAAPRAAVDIPVYTLGSGDRVKITVFGEDDLSGQFEISSAGEIAFPLIGDVKAAGLSLRQVAEEIAAKLLDGFLKKPRVNVEVVNYRPFYILGEVKRPGSYPYVGRMTVINAVALGGGFTHRAQKGRMSITRATDPQGREQLINSDDVVLPGDVIRVPERFF